MPPVAQANFLSSVVYAFFLSVLPSLFPALSRCMSSLNELDIRGAGCIRLTCLLAGLLQQHQQTFLLIVLMEMYTVSNITCRDATERDTSHKADLSACRAAAAASAINVLMDMYTVSSITHCGATDRDTSHKADLSACKAAAAASANLPWASSCCACSSAAAALLPAALACAVCC